MATHRVAAAVALPEVAWHVSTRSGSGSGNCVEAGPVLDGSGRVAVRDSKDRGGHVLVYRNAGWNAFLDALRGGRLGPGN
ncbi:DUF397 domain-containing protein [Plantactinospora endophytica]|uniref:DUF397 domain-containing protein n=1 Tax=Plantactinospora endophytica TaxID=673535 RepID=A0ABQ4E3B5_9ACTN|nr:DUF397 domain-containing protein [Plantactinospora endophytica]GIG88801.1 hypothetical protein Pen02_37370 [Plantactinospora endophytica]